MTLTTCRWEAAEASGTPPTPPAKSAGDGPLRSRQRRAWALLIAVAVIASALASGIGSAPVIKPEGARSFLDFFRTAFHPRLDGAFLALTANATLTTLAYAVLGTALSLVIGVLGGVLIRRPGGRPASVPGAHADWRDGQWRGAFSSCHGRSTRWCGACSSWPYSAWIRSSRCWPSASRSGRSPRRCSPNCSTKPPASPMPPSWQRGRASERPSSMDCCPPALPDLLSYGFYRFECAIRSAAILGLVGAGGLGFQLALSFQTLRYHEIWTLLYALILPSVAADYWSSVVRRGRTRGGRRRQGIRRDPLLIGSPAIAAALIGLSTWWVGLDVSALWSGRAWGFGTQLLADAWPPVIGEGGFGGLLALSAATLAMSIVAIALAFCGGALLAVPAANPARRDHRTDRSRLRRATRTLVLVAARLVLVVLRAIPPPVWALLLLFVMYPGILPGALALAVYTIGILGRLMAETVDNLDQRPLRAIRAHGASESQVFCYGVIPAAAPRFVAYGLYRWEVTIRDTVVVGVVGAGGLGLLLDHQLGSFHHAAALSTLIALIVLTLLVDVASAAIRRSLR